MKFNFGNFYLRSLTMMCAFFIYACSSSRTGIGEQEANNNSFTTQSPDKSIAVQFNLSDGMQASYTISRNDTLVLEESKLGT